MLRDDESVTQQPCPKSESGATHHLVPRLAGRNAQGEPVQELACEYCGKTAKELRG